MSNPEREYLLVTEYFHPDTASTGQLMTDLAVGLSERGLDLTVYTSQPNYHSGDNQKQPWESIHDGVLVRRIRAPQVRQTSMIRRLFNWLVFTVWMSARLLWSRTDRERELVFVTCPPMLPVAMGLVCRLRGWEYTYIAFDLYPDESVELGYVAEGGVVHRLWGWLDARTFENAKHVVALGPAMRARILNKTGPECSADRITIIHNWEDGEFIRPRSKAENRFCAERGLVDTFTVLYSGNIGQFHDHETLIRAASAFEDRDVCFLIIGEGDNKAEAVSLARNLGVLGNTVRFLPYQPRSALPYTLTAGDVSAVTVKKGVEGILVSSKMYTSMAAGTPILAIAHPDGDEARLIDTFDIGRHVEQGDVDGAVQAIDDWIADPELVTEQGANARTAFEEHFTESESIDRYYRMLTGAPLAPDVLES